MKHSKSIIYTLVLSMAFSLYSCDGGLFGNQEDNIEQSETSGSVTGSVNNLQEKVKTLESQLVDVSQKINNVETDIKSFANDKSCNTWGFLIGYGLGVISFIMAVVAMIKVSKYKQRLDRHREDIDTLKSKCGEYRHQDNTSRSNYSSYRIISNSDYSTLARKIQSLEEELFRMKSMASADPVIKLVPASEVPVTKIQSVKIGYFGTVISGEGGTGYFKKMLEYKDGDARFLVKSSETTTEFEPIATLPMIKSSDYMELAIEFNGCSKSEAMNMTLDRPGIVEQLGDKWIVKQKALVTLTK